MDKRRDVAIVAVIVGLGWAFWLHRLGINDHDDMLSNELLFARQGLATLLFRNPWPDQSPLYFLYLHGVRAVGESPFVIQLLNAVLLTLTLGATYRFALEFSESKSVARVAVFLGAVSPTSLWLVRSGRMYSLQLLFSVLAALLVVRYVAQGRRRDLVGFGVLALLNIYTHFFGFLITALLFVPLLAEAWFETRTRRASGATGVWRPFSALALVACGVAALAIPQLLRLASLMGSGVPTRANISLPMLSTRFLDRVSWFWFVNSSWGALQPGERLVTGVYVGCIVLLALAGLTAVRRRTGVAAALWILFPLAGVGLAAARMDIRDRYFVWTLPLLWTAVATGGVGPLPNRLAGAGGDFVRGVRAALVVAVATGSLWLLWHKLPEPYGEWTKLMMGVERLYQPSMLAYMPPGSPLGIPRAIAMRQNMPAALRDVQSLSPDTHDQFLAEVEHGQDFVFLVYTGQENDELRWRVRYLEERQYRKAVIPVYAASAQFFTRNELAGFSEAQQLEPNPTPDAIVAWARQQLHSRPSSAAATSPTLADAVVARVAPDGVARTGKIFISQRGERGAWRLGPLEWDAVEQSRTVSAQIEQDMIAAHPAAGSVLVVAFPARTMKKSLALTYGIADTGLVFRAGANVDVEFYVNGTKRFGLSCPNTPGWKTQMADTASIEGQSGDVVMLLTTRDDTSRHFAFRLEASGEAAPGTDDAARAAGPVSLRAGHKLSDTVEQLRVYRLEGDQRIDAQGDGRVYSASDMHEVLGSAGEGAVHRVWSLGEPLWDAVGSTRQFSGREARKGIWAHPRNGTTLVIEASQVQTGDVLRGFFGFTDSALDMARSINVSAPVSFTIWLDGRRAFEQDVARTPGWSGLVIPAGGPARAHDLRVEIASPADKWGHFIFDLWSD